MLLAAQIGTNSGIANWPTNDLDGLFDALKRWPLDIRFDLSTDPAYAECPGTAPFRGRAWGNCVFQYNEVMKKRVAVATKPIYPDHPNAVRYCGNFVSYSFGFWFDTYDADLISRSDHAIAENLAVHNCSE